MTNVEHPSYLVNAMFLRKIVRFYFFEVDFLCYVKLVLSDLSQTENLRNLLKTASLWLKWVDYICCDALCHHRKWKCVCENRSRIS